MKVPLSEDAFIHTVPKGRTVDIVVLQNVFQSKDFSKALQTGTKQQINS